MWDKHVSKPHGFRRAIVMKLASWLPCKVLSIRRPGSTSCCEHQSLSNGDSRVCTNSNRDGLVGALHA
jgi:hypothetical protein